MLRRPHRDQRRLRRQTHGRRLARLLRLSPGSRTGCRERGARGARDHHRGTQAEYGGRRPAARACRRRDGERGGRRSSGGRRGAGARRRRRHAEPRGAAAGDRRARRCGHRRGHERASRQSLRASGLGNQRPQGDRETRAGLGGAEREPDRQPVRGAARNGADAARRARRRMRLAAEALGAGEGGRRTGGPPFRRGRDRQVAARRRAHRATGRRTADAAALVLLSAAHRRRALSHHRRDGARREVRARRRAASQVRQARRAAEVHLGPGRGRSAHRRDDVPEERRTLPGDRPCAAAAPAKNPAGARGATGGGCSHQPCADDLRGRAVVGPHEPRSAEPRRGPHPDASRAADRKLPAGIPRAVDRAVPRHDGRPQSAGRARHRRHDRCRRRREAAAGDHPPGHRRAQRRRAAVRRGDDEGSTGGGGRGQSGREPNPDGSRDLAGLVDGAARSDGPGQGSRAGRRSDRP